MFRPDYDKWYNSIPEHTRGWLENQPTWYDKDLILSFIAGFILGAIIIWIL